MTNWQVDAHVHLHPAQLSARSLVSLAGRSGPASATPTDARVWCLADMPGVASLATLRETNFQSSLSALGVDHFDDRGSWIAVTGADWRLILVDGEQCVSAENIELLTVGGKLADEGRQSLDSLITRTLEADLIPILPWGVGKWFGARGRLIGEILSAGRFRGRLALADSGTRPVGWPQSRLLRQARAAGYAVLHGSDSLRVAGDQRRTGRYGFSLPETAASSPLAVLRDYLAAPHREIEYFGRRISPWHFVKSQLLLRVRKS